MALISFTAPDGRMLTVPDTLMSSFQLPPDAIIQPSAPPPLPEQQIAAPPGGAPMFAGAELGPPPITPDMAPPPEQPPQTPSPPPQAAPAPTPPVPTEQAAGAAPSAPVPVPSPIAAAPATFAGAESLARGGIAQREQAAQLTGDIEAQKAEAQAAEQQRRNAEIERLRLKREQERVVEQQEIARRQADYDKATDTHAKYKIDEGRRWRNLSTGRKIAVGIAVALSAIGDVLQRKSGPNMALQIIKDGIKEDVQAQLRDREGLKEVAIGKRSSLDDYMKSTGRKEDAFSLKLAEEYKRTANELERQAAQFEAPSAKVRALGAAGALRQDAAGILGGLAQGGYQRSKDERAFAEQVRARKDESARGWAGISLQRQGMDLKKQELDFEARKEAAKLLAAGKADEAKLVRERGISGNPVPVKDEQGNVVRVKNDILRNPDGTPWIPQGSNESIDRLRRQKGAADNLVSIIDETLRLGPEWLSDTANSDKLNQLKALWSDAKLKVKNFEELGVIAGPDLPLMEGFLGTEDPTRFKNSLAGIKQARKNIVRNANKLLQVAGYDGEYAPADLGQPAPPAASEDDANIKEVARGVDLHRRDAGDFVRSLGVEPKGTLASTMKEAAAALHKAGGILPRHRDLMNHFGELAASSDPKARSRGSEALSQWANSSDPAIRSYAAEILNRNVTRDIASPVLDGRDRVDPATGKVR